MVRPVLGARDARMVFTCWFSARCDRAGPPAPSGFGRCLAHLPKLGRGFGIWLRCHTGHVMPSGTFLAGDCPDNAVEIGDVAGPATAEIHTDGLPCVARRIQDANVAIGVVLVPHDGAHDAAVFLADALARYCIDRRRIQLEARELEEENQLLRQERVRRTHDHGIIHVSGIIDDLITAVSRAATWTPPL